MGRGGGVATPQDTPETLFETIWSWIGRGTCRCIMEAARWHLAPHRVPLKNLRLCNHLHTVYRGWGGGVYQDLNSKISRTFWGENEKGNILLDLSHIIYMALFIHGIDIYIVYICKIGYVLKKINNCHGLQANLMVWWSMISGSRDLWITWSLDHVISGSCDILLWPCGKCYTSLVHDSIKDHIQLYVILDHISGYRYMVCFIFYFSMEEYPVMIPRLTATLVRYTAST